MRLRKQKDVQKENDFYMQLLQQALRPEQQTSSLQPDKTKGNVIGYGQVISISLYMFCGGEILMLIMYLYHSSISLWYEVGFFFLLFFFFF